MAYFLGIDIGTTYTAAAVWRDGRYEVASLGNRAPTIPSVVLLRDDEAVLTGEAAVRRAATEPGRVAREFKRRIGDPTPILVGGTPYSADALMAKLLRWVVDHVTQAEGGPPGGIAVTHPANWGNYKLDLLRQAISLADLDGVATVSEPEAAAIHYASQARVEPGSVIAVYDLGGGTFDAAVLRKTGTGWEILGSPEGIERLGGVDFDAAVYHHVAQATGGAIDQLDPDDPTARAAVARLRQECIDAKEALSSDSDVSIPVLLPNLQTEVRLTRAEYESMVRPALADSITAMNRALRSADVAPDQVTAVLLVGGSSRTPLVAELVSSALGRPVAVDAHPKYGVALGAAITAAQRAGAHTAAGAAVGAAPSGDDPAGSSAPPAAGAPAAGVVPPLAVATAAAGAAAAAASSSPRAGHDSQATADSAPGADPGAHAGATSAAAAAHETPAGAAPPGAGDDAGAAAGAPGADRGTPAPAASAPRVVGGVPAGAPPATAAESPHAAATQAQGAPPPTEPSPSTSVFPGPSRREAGDASRRSGDAGHGGRDTRSITVPYSGAPLPPRDDGARRSVGDDRPPGDGGNGGHGRTPSRRPVALVAVALLVLAIVAGGAYAALNAGDDGDPAATADPGSDTTAGDATTTAPPDTTTTTPQPEGPFVQIDDVVVEGGLYRVNYHVIGYEPQVDGGPDSLHIHFFLDTTEPQNAGTNGSPPGVWNLTDESTSFLTEFGPETKGEATQMCSAVATVDHQVFHQGTLTGNCVDLPA